MAKMKTIDIICITLIVIGAINWGLIGAFNFNLVQWIFGVNWFTNLLYMLVGLAGIVSIFRLAYKN